MASPSETHRRKATCAEVDCPHYLQGWITTVAVGSPQALYIKHHSERRFIEKTEAGQVMFKFYPGQECFREHSASLGRPPFLLHRKNGPPRRIIEPQEFNDTFNEEMRQIELARQRG
tara:strand:- start:843 stop:1193 length:351 start_codon:yes stop_codon:yes gene_type:complete